MSPEQAKQFQKINHLHDQVTKATSDYWHSYSNMGTWQFWLLLVMLIMPLVILYFVMDRRKALLIGFFGLNVHIWFQYIDTYGVTHALWNYPYKIIPFIPVNIALDTSIVPVSFMMIYQWTINHNKNYYLYAMLWSAFISFVFKPILVALELFKLYKGLNYFSLFLMYLSVMLISKLLTDLFIHFQKEQKKKAQVE